jgi:outer membrane protein TolC
MYFASDVDNQKQADYAPIGNLQTTALLNRLDIRIALERYAVSEAKLKLEIAKQYPNIIISPGYAYEFGDSIWSLGLSGLLTILNKNKLAIAEATQLREVEATQFEALQSRTIAQADTANVELILAKQALDNQQKLREQQKLNTQRSERKFKAGEIDRLGLAFSQLENINADKSVALSQFQLKNAQNQLENALQIPLSAVNSTSENQQKNIIKLEDLSLKEPKNKTIE